MHQRKYLLVLTVPMRNGNLVGTNHVFPWLIVLTVPMRNGNHGIPSVLTIRTGSYRTYEEWKHGIPCKATGEFIAFLPYLWGMETKKKFSFIILLLQFLPYLWGMETRVRKSARINAFQRSYRTYEEWKPSSGLSALQQQSTFLPYLWGMETLIQWSESKKIEKVLTVPMRNGNNPCATPQKSFGRHSSYRTYEEWKQWRSSSTNKAIPLFLPYLWGMETILERFARINRKQVLNVPMRNGNLFPDGKVIRLHSVLTVPMRNGNV